MSLIEQLIIILLVCIFTMITRFLPFMVFGKMKKLPNILEYLQTVLPFAIFGLLVVYCLKDVSVLEYSYGIPEAIGVLSVVILYLISKNTLVSIFVGTIFYMVLIQIVFV